MTNNVLKQLTYNMPEGGEGIIVRRAFNPNQLAVSGATRATSSNSRQVDVVVLDAANESVIIPFPVPVDMDLDKQTLICRVGVMAGLVSGSSTPTLDVNLDTLTAIRAGESAINDAVAAITPPSTTATQLDTVGEIQTIEFDLSATLRGLGDLLSLGDALAIEIDAEAVSGTSPVAHLYGAYIEYQSMIVAALTANRV